MKPNFIRGAPAIVSLTALSVVLAAIPAGSETTSAAVAAPTPAANPEITAEKQASWWNIAGEQAPAGPVPGVPVSTSAADLSPVPAPAE